MKIVLKIFGSLLAIVPILFVIALVRSPIDPAVWTPAPNPGLTGVFAPNQKLANVQLLLENQGKGPEDITQGPDGWFYTGVEDGRILRFSSENQLQEIANTQGRPLGLRFDQAGQLIVADALKGLLSISPDGQMKVLTDSVDGTKMTFVDALDIAADGTIWFSDASQRVGYDGVMHDFLEVRPSGRLLSYSPKTGKTSVHLSELFFANGVALGPDDSFVLINETGTGRIHRLWLKGEKAGSNDLFYDGLPGGPDNISFNGTDLFWVATPMIRSAELEGLADQPMLRKLLGALPQGSLYPLPEKGMVLALDLEGNVVHNLQSLKGNYSGITSVSQFGDQLYMGSLYMSAVATHTVPK